jgi:hypothetical protein
MLLAFVPHFSRATISIITHVITAERPGISQGSVHTRDSIIRIIRKLLCPNNRTRINRGAITRILRRARPRRKLDESFTRRAGQYLKESPS